MGNMLLGAVLPNEPRPLTAEEVECLRAVGPGCVRMWDYTPEEAVRQVLALNPRCWFIVRPREELPSDPTKLIVAGFMLQRLGADFAFNLANEPNHPSSRYAQEWPEGIVAFQGDYTELRKHIRGSFGAPIVSPNLAVMHWDLEWAQTCHDLFTGDDYIGVNAYWQGDNYKSPNWGLRIKQFRSIWPDKEFVVLEVGDASPNENMVNKTTKLQLNRWAMKRLGYVAAWNVFMLGGTPDWKEFYLPLEGWKIIAKGGNSNVATWERHQVFNDWFKRFGQGYNPNSAIGAYRSAHPELGVAISGEIDYGPAVVMQFATAMVGWDKVAGQIFVARTEEELPTSLPLA